MSPSFAKNSSSVLVSIAQARRSPYSKHCLSMYLGLSSASLYPYDVDITLAGLLVPQSGGPLSYHQQSQTNFLPPNRTTFVSTGESIRINSVVVGIVSSAIGRVQRIEKVVKGCACVYSETLGDRRQIGSILTFLGVSDLI